MKATKTEIIDRYQGRDLWGFTQQTTEIPSFDCLDCRTVSSESLESLAEAVIRSMSAKGLTLKTSESLTGGMLASTIISVSGASKVFLEGFVTYSEESKMKRLGVSEQTLLSFGAVSYQTAFEMAKGTLQGADYSLSTTGLAGPGGDRFSDKIGMVFVGFASQNQTIVRGFRFTGDRKQIRENSVRVALCMLLEALNK